MILTHWALSGKVCADKRAQDLLEFRLVGVCKRWLLGKQVKGGTPLDLIT